jgi:hypothetical protein
MAIRTKECSYDDLRPHLVRLIEHHRIEDDPVHYCCDVSASPKYWLGYLWGNPEPYDYAHVITAIEPAFDPRYGHMVAVQGEGMGVLECPISQAAQAKLITELETAVAAAKSSPEPEISLAQPTEETAAGVADRLQRLDDLLAQGVITAEEHQQRRQAILAEL